ncbi:MAG: hypothetical protein HY394_04585 [Candidatus Diapherotrites archaeon]|nr:hypothetical protein [Candidatus Diapherotrites archaeon]
MTDSKNQTEEMAKEIVEGELKAEEQAAEASGEEDEGTVDESKLPFPRATIVNMMRKHLSQGKQIKGQVKDEMNIWLGKMVERIAKKMDAYPYTYVDYSMFREAVETYEKVQDIELEKERIIKYLEKIKADCDSLAREVDRKFEL